MIILGIETSCDETAISVIEANGDLNSLSFNLLGSSVHSQIDIHKEYGGVFPTLAKREHQKKLVPVLIDCLKRAGFLQNENFSNKDVSRDDWAEEITNIKSKMVGLEKIDYIFVTVGPGLEPALWVGIEFAKKLGEIWDKKVSGVNHMEGHIASVLMNTNENNEQKSTNKKIEFPALALLISGGHTEIIYLKNWQEKEKIGQTLDDAVGEAFDKVARMLSLPYPGGPEISKLATEARNENLQSEKKFPRPMIHSNNYDFSFSGLKTAVLYHIQKLEKNNQLNTFQKKIIAMEFEDAVIETLLSKTKKAIEEFGPRSLIIGGGVIANRLIREKFLNLQAEYNLYVHIPDKNLATDNATMIAMAGYIEYLCNKKEELKASGNLKIQTP